MITIIKSQIDKINIIKLIKILPVVFTFHEIEEWNVLKWHLQYQTNVPEVSDIDLRTIFLFLIVFSYILVYLALIPKNKRITAYLLIPFISFLFYNGLVHLYWTIYFKSYSPGLIFGFFAGVPLYLLIVYKFIQLKMVKKWYLFIFGVLTAVLLVQIILLKDKLDPAIANLMLLGRQLAEWIW
ncbi:MAG: HXXEE domain-containing protein [Bacteroidales bacterium]|nr:HXXEE domain-containing protein [Bacteroidales bacterium]